MLSPLGGTVGNTYTNDRGMPSEHIGGFNRGIRFRVGVDIPVLKKSYELTLYATERYTNQWHTVMSSDAPKTYPDLLGFHASPNPSLVCPTSLISGLQTPPLSGSLACFVRSKMRTSPVTDLVAIKSGFCGIYLALLTSPA